MSVQDVQHSQCSMMKNVHCQLWERDSTIDIPLHSFKKDETPNLEKIIDTNTTRRYQMEEKQHVQNPLFEAEMLNNDKEVAIAAVRTDWQALKTMSDVFKGDTEVVLAAVTQNGLALEFASHELQNEKEVVLAAVTQNGRAMKYASEELHNDKEFVLASVTRD